MQNRNLNVCFYNDSKEILEFFFGNWFHKYIYHIFFWCYKFQLDNSFLNFIFNKAIFYINVF